MNREEIAKMFDVPVEMVSEGPSIDELRRQQAKEEREWIESVMERVLPDVEERVREAFGLPEDSRFVWEDE
jgi:phage portal protein BeeE